MTKKTFSQLDDGEAQVTSQSILPFEQSGSTLKSKVSVLVDGPTVKYINTVDDLPPLVGGFRLLEQNTVYQINDEIFLSDEFMVPAGWNGVFRSSHNPRNAIIYLGSNSLFNTLNIDGTITSFADSTTSPGVKTTVTTSTPHGLNNGDTVNITGVPTETGYNNRRLIISNVTASTYDIEIVFTSTDTGLFDTGYLGIQLRGISFFDGTGTGTLFDISAIQDPESIFAFENLGVFGFSSLGIIRNAPTISSTRGFLLFINSGLIIENCDTCGITDSNFTNINPASTTSINLTITGAATRDIVLGDVKFNVAHPDQRPFRIDPSVNNADAITIQTCPDNGVATDYFDTSSGGLDQTNKQIVTFNNGKRANSSDLAEAMSNGVLEIPGVTTSVAEPIQQAVPVAGDFALDSTVEGFTMDDSTGIVTHNGRAAKKVRIEYALEVAQTSAGVQDIDIDLRINGAVQSKTMRSISTMGVDSFTPISYLGGFFNVTPGDTFQLFKTNNTNTTSTDIRNLVLLIK